MDFINAPTPWLEVVRLLDAKELLPTDLSSAELRGLDAWVKRQSIFSARTDLTHHLDRIKAVVGSIVQPQTIERADRITPENPKGLVTVGHNPATAKAALRKGLLDEGYAPSSEERGTIKDLSSDARLNLVVKTNVQLAQGAGRLIQGNGAHAVAAMPAWELVRFEARRVPRGEKEKAGALVPDPENGWPERFRAAALASGDTDALRVLNATGRMMARKDSPLWDSLGDGAGGFDDVLNNPFPPFAFNTGMNWLGVPRKECEALGLIRPGEQVQPKDFDFDRLLRKEAA